MVEITSRTLQSRMLLRPSPFLREAMIGIIGRAQARYGMTIHGVGALSNHYHALVSPDSAKQLARFMSLVNGKIAKETARHHDWPQKVWSKPYEPIPVTQEEEAQVGRLIYLLAHGAKEGLVADPRDWPGMHCARALLGDGVMFGVWYDRTREYAARRRGAKRPELEFAAVETVRLSPLPCWSHLEPAVLRQRALELIEQIVRRAASEADPSTPRNWKPAGPCGVSNPHQRPRRTKRTPAPLVHAASEQARREFYDAYRLFLDAKSEG